MAIVRMKKMTLVAPKDEREGILNLLQKQGHVELVDLKNELGDCEEVDFYKQGNVVSDTETDYSKIKFTYEFLKQHSDKKSGLFDKRDLLSGEEFESFDNNTNWREIYQQCKEIEEGLSLNKTKRGKAASLIEQYALWTSLDISDAELNMFKKTGYFIGSVSKKYETQLFDELSNQFKDVYIEKIFEKQQDINLLILCHLNDVNVISDVLKKYGFTKLSLDISSTPKKQLESLSKEVEEIDLENKALYERAKQLSENIKDIEKMFDYIDSKVQKEKATSKLVKTEKTFLLQGWLPENKVSEVNELISKEYKDAFIEFNDPTEDEETPIVLKNNALVEPFEVITSMYALPKTQEVDPTPVLAPFFLIFFGMMAADIGYGLVMLIASTFALMRMDVEGSTKKMIKLIQYCSAPTILFGALYGSFFGGIIKLTPIWIDPVNEPMTVLMASIVLGIIHLYVGLGVKAYMLIRDGKAIHALTDVGFWYMLVSGIIWMLLGGGSPAKIIAILGALGLLLTQGRESKTIVGKFFGGVYALYGITGYLGDALSYSRLLALGLASGLIGWSFNLLIGLLGGGVVAMIFGPIIFVAGHSFNFFIGVLGTFVHTCRLQYLEFFGKFYSGGGKAFEPLRINTKFIKVKTER
jgi:V/A-type H+/Na+-transporting ATPase subunit I